MDPFLYHPVPNWIERLLGVPAEAGRGRAWSAEFAWPGPAWTALGLALLLTILVIALYLRQGGRSSRRYRLSLAAVRLAALAIVMLMIGQLSLLLTRTGLPSAVVLLDNSLSMTTVNDYTPQARAAMAAQFAAGDTAHPDWSRWGLLGQLLRRHDAQLLRGIAREHQLQVDYLTDLRPSRSASVAGIVAEIEASKPRGETTRFGAAIGTILDQLRGASPAAIVVLTDGVNTEGPTLADAAQDARRRGVPLLIVGLGSDRPAAEVKLSNLLADDTTMVDDLVTFEFSLTARGLEGRKLAVVLRRNDPPAVLARTQVAALTDGRSQRVQLSWRPRETGRVEYTIAAEPQPGEPPYDRNRLAGALDVRKEKISVLLAAAIPSFEYRYLSNVLRQEQTVALKTVLQDADAKNSAQDPTALAGFPLRRDDVFAFDAVILDDVNPALLGPAALRDLAEFVRRPGKGGAGGDCRAGPLARGVARHAAGPAAADKRRIGPPAPPGRSPGRRLRGAADRPRAGQPRDAAWRYSGGNQPHLAESAAAGLAAGSAGAETGGKGPGRRPHARRARRPAFARHLFPVRRRRQGLVSRHGRDLAMALPGRGPLFCPLLAPDAPLALPLEAGRGRPHGDAGR